MVNWNEFTSTLTQIENFAEVSVAAQERILAQEKLLQPWIGFGNAADISETDLQQLIAKTVSIFYFIQKT